MHEYYAKNKAKIRRTLKGYLKYIAPELEAASKLSYDGIFEEIWAFYEKEILEDLPFIGGDESSGTASLTSAYMLVATGEVMKRYGVFFEESNKLLYIMYKRYAEKIPGIVKPVAGMLLKKPWLVQKNFKRIDKQNAAVAKKYPGCFETETKVPPDEGSVFSFYMYGCPIASSAKKHGYDDYVPYMCNLDYVLYGAMGIPLRRTHTCFIDGDYCDYNVIAGAEIFEGWPQVFTLEGGYK